MGIFGDDFTEPQFTPEQEKMRDAAGGRHSEDYKEWLKNNPRPDRRKNPEEYQRWREKSREFNEKRGKQTIREIGTGFAMLEGRIMPLEEMQEGRLVDMTVTSQKLSRVIDLLERILTA